MAFHCAMSLEIWLLTWDHLTQALSGLPTQTPRMQIGLLGRRTVVLGNALVLGVPTSNTASTKSASPKGLKFNNCFLIIKG
jgi:hypothetical protein